MLEKSPISSKLYEQMVANMPINVMLMEPENFTITYANKTSIDTLWTLEQGLGGNDETRGLC